MEVKETSDVGKWGSGGEREKKKVFLSALQLCDP
jgi:hypothetical protein